MSFLTGSGGDGRGGEGRGSRAGEGAGKAVTGLGLQLPEPWWSCQPEDRRVSQNAPGSAPLGHE